MKLPWWMKVLSGLYPLSIAFVSVGTWAGVCCRIQCDYASICVV